MLRQVTLEIPVEDRIRSTARVEGARLNVIQCKGLKDDGMVLLIELEGRKVAVNETTQKIRRIPGIRYVIPSETGRGMTHLLVNIECPKVCRVARDGMVFCLDCPLNSRVMLPRWRFICEGPLGLDQVISNLRQQGIRAKVKEVSPLWCKKRSRLTEKQRALARLAVASGYFDYPRKVNLQELSRLAGKSRTSVSEMMRGAERRIIRESDLLYATTLRLNDPR